MIKIILIPIVLFLLYMMLWVTLLPGWGTVRCEENGWVLENDMYVFCKTLTLGWIDPRFNFAGNRPF